MLRQDQSSLTRAVFGALPATSLLLLACFIPAIAAATDVRCNRSGGVDELPDRLNLEVMDLAGDSRLDVDDQEVARDLDRLPSIAPDLSSRARSMAILREIFGEPVTRDSLDIGRTEPPRAPVDGSDPVTGTSPLNQSATGIAESDGPQPAESLNLAPGVPDSDARLPGVSEEESQRYRRQMYRTDI